MNREEYARQHLLLPWKGPQVGTSSPGLSHLQSAPPWGLLLLSGNGGNVPSLGSMACPTVTFLSKVRLKCADGYSFGLILKSFALQQRCGRLVLGTCNTPPTECA